MEQERADLESAQWLRELRAALDDVLVDVRYAVEPESFDFVLVYSPGTRRRAIERFSEAFTRTREIPPFDHISFEDGDIPEPWNEYRSIRAVEGTAAGQGDGYPVRMAQERADFDSASWVAVLRAAMGGELIDVRCVAEGDGYDFIVVHAPGARRAALGRFLAALRADEASPPFEFMLFEVGQVPDYYNEYVSIGPAPAHAQ
jgi:hypothetical protein